MYINKLIWVGLCLAILCSCGREPSRLLRQGQLPIYDFPLYLTEGASGRIWSLDRDATKTLIAEGLNDPRGVATDRFGNIFVAEYGSGRLLKFTDGASTPEVMLDGLDGPSTVAVDSFGEVYVTQDGQNNISRASDRQVFASYDALPSALAFGVDDTPIVGLFDRDEIRWGFDEGSPATALTAPINASIDGTGRVYVADGSASGKVVRFHQRSPEGATVVADNLVGPAGIAVDPVGNIFIVEQGAGRIILISYDGIKFAWITDTTDPQFLAFTQY